MLLESIQRNKPTITDPHPFIDFLDGEKMNTKTLDAIYNILNIYYDEKNVFENEQFRGLKYNKNPTKYLVIQKVAPFSCHMGILEDMIISDVIKFINSNIDPMDNIIEELNKTHLEMSELKVHIEHNGFMMDSYNKMASQRTGMVMIEIMMMSLILLIMFMVIHG